MITKLAKKIVAYQIERKILAETDGDLYEYVYELFINQSFNILITVLIAALFSVWIPALVFVLMYIPMRSVGGGYHASSNERCLVVSALLVIAVCYAWTIFPGSTPAWMLWVEIAAFLISGFGIYMLAPVGHINKPIEPEDEGKFKKYIVILWLLHLVIWFLFLNHFPAVSLIMAVTHLLFVLMLWLGAIHLKRELSEYE